MLFNSAQFAIFLPIVFVLYWFVTNRNLKVQNILLLFAGYVFYGWWDLRFLGLLILLSVSNYFIGIEVADNQRNTRGKFWFVMGLFVNLGVLGVFKYYNFFIDSFIDIISLLGYDMPRSTTKILLPVGISFYTFLSLSYIIDIHKRTINANRNIVEVLLALSFFPIILAGPIQRPVLLLPQISQKREFDYNQAVEGLKRVLWGIFIKVVIADNLAIFVDPIFSNFANYSGSALILGAIFYSIQIYADFSGYSEIAIGVGKLFGFNLMRNFSFPYFSRDIAEFWKRWHISLTTWFRDYIFLPVSFNLSWKLQRDNFLNIKKDFFIYIIASLVTWFITGLWHGANYTYIIWGMMHGMLLIMYKWHLKPRKRIFKKLNINNKNILVIIIETLLTFAFLVVTWIIFKADSIKDAIEYISNIFTVSFFSIDTFPGLLQSFVNLILVIGFFYIEWRGKELDYSLAYFSLRYNKPFRWAIYCVMIACIFLFSGQEQQFIYFQF